MSEVTAADFLEAIITLASNGASKFSSKFDKDLLESAITDFTSGEPDTLWALAMVGSSTKEEIDLVNSFLSAFEATS